MQKRRHQAFNGSGKQNIVVAEQKEEFSGGLAQAKIEVADQAEVLFLLKQDHAGIANLPDSLHGIIRGCIVRYNHLNIRISLGDGAANGSKSQAAAVDGRNSDGNSPEYRHDGLVTNVPSGVACEMQTTSHQSRMVWHGSASKARVAVWK